MQSNSAVTTEPPTEKFWEPGARSRLCFDAILVAAGIGCAVVSVKLGLGTLATPAAGMVPLIASVLIITMFALDLAVTLAKREFGRGAGRPPWRAVAILLSIPLYVVSAGYLGHIVAAVLVVLLLLISFGARKWRVIAVTAVLSGVLSYALFTQLLGVSLPTGAFGIGW